MTQPHEFRHSWSRWFISRRIWRATHGQDLIEYALMAGLMAASTGAVMPHVVKDLSKIFKSVKSVLKVAKTQGS